MRCKNCGKKISNDSSFCTYCGGKIEIENIETKMSRVNVTVKDVL